MIHGRLNEMPRHDSDLRPLCQHVRPTPPTHDDRIVTHRADAHAREYRLLWIFNTNTYLRRTAIALRRSADTCIFHEPPFGPGAQRSDELNTIIKKCINY